jgi:hypothetical protein
MIRQSCSGGSRPRVLRDVIRGIRTEGPPGSGPQGPEPSGGPCPKIGRRFPGPDLPPGSPRVPGSPGPRVRTEGLPCRPPRVRTEGLPCQMFRTEGLKCSGPRVSRVLRDRKDPDRGCSPRSGPKVGRSSRIPTEVVRRDPRQDPQDPDRGCSGPQDPAGRRIPTQEKDPDRGCSRDPDRRSR